MTNPTTNPKAYSSAQKCFISTIKNYGLVSTVWNGMVAWHEVTAMVRYAAFLDTALNTVTCHRHMYTAKSLLKWPLLN